MTIVMEMSTDADIINTQLNPAWNPITNRYSWAQVSAMNLNIGGTPRIVVIAHGNGDEIGNAAPGTIDINPQVFLALIQGNMAAGTAPGSIYISSCGPGIAEFAAGVRIAAEQNQIWANTDIFGHSVAIAGPVPAPTALSWFEIFSG